MHGNSAHRVIDMRPAIHEHDGNHHQQPGHHANEGRQAGSGGIGLGGDGHQPCQNAVEAHGQVRLAPPQTRQDQGRHTAPRRRDIGIDEDQGDGIGIGHGGDAQLGTAIEAEPTQPQDHGAQGGEGHVGTGYGHGLQAATGFLHVFALARPQEQHPGQSGGGAGQMHHATAGEIQEARLVEDAAAPFPVAFDGIDDAGHDHGEQQEGPQFHALGHGPGDDGHGRRHEHHLEEEIGEIGMTGFASRIHHLAQAVIQPQEKAQGRNPGAVALAVHDVVTHEHEHDAGDGIQGNVLGQNLRHALGAHHARFEHGKARGHPHDQGAGHEQEERILGIDEFDECDFHGGKTPIGDDTLRLKRQAACLQGSGQPAGHGPALLFGFSPGGFGFCLHARFHDVETMIVAVRGSPGLGRLGSLEPAVHGRIENLVEELLHLVRTFGVAAMTRLFNGLFDVGHHLDIETVGHFEDTFPMHIIRSEHGRAMTGPAAFVVPQVEVVPLHGLVELGLVAQAVLQHGHIQFLGRNQELVVEGDNESIQLLEMGIDDVVAVTGAAHILHVFAALQPGLDLLALFDGLGIHLGGNRRAQVPGNAVADVVGHRQILGAAHVAGGAGGRGRVVLAHDPLA